MHMIADVTDVDTLIRNCMLQTSQSILTERLNKNSILLNCYDFTNLKLHVRICVHDREYRSMVSACKYALSCSLMVLQQPRHAGATVYTICNTWIDRAGILHLPVCVYYIICKLLEFVFNVKFYTLSLGRPTRSYALLLNFLSPADLYNLRDSRVVVLGHRSPTKNSSRHFAHSIPKFYRDQKVRKLATTFNFEAPWFRN